MHRAIRPALLLALALPLAAFRPADPPVKPTPFTAEVAAHFSVWDRDSDGALQPDELDALVVDPHLKGASAAAVGVLKSAQRSGKTDLPPITLDYLRTYEQTVADHKTPIPNFDRSYNRAMRRINTAKRDLLVGEQPSLDTCHQGPLGDCYFISVVGAAVARDAASVRDMISAAHDGSFDVAFPDGRRAKVAPLTDAELALTSTSGNEGLWLPVLEKAYGSLRNDSLPEDKQSESATDAIAKGGSTTTTIRLMTGHAVTRLALRPRSPGAPKAAEGAPTPPPPPEPDPETVAKRVDAALPKLRERLAVSMKDHRLVAAGTPKEGNLPPGINPGHAYAVLGFDDSADTIHLWNPHGNTFHPKGEAGLETGYLTKAGHFTMPLADFARVFQGIAFETDKPAPAVR